MFILYAVVLGVALGVALGGRLDGLAGLHFRWGWLALAGLIVQLVLFADPVAERIGSLGVPIYVASTAAVALTVLANHAIAGMAVVAAGALSNLAAILANGGYMPAAPGALATLGHLPPSEYSNSAIVAHPVLEPLTDLYALPAWLPGHNVFSVGDVLIGLGVAIVIVVAMRSAGRLAAADPAGRDAAADAPGGVVHADN